MEGSELQEQFASSSVELKSKKTSEDVEVDQEGKEVRVEFPDVDSDDVPFALGRTVVLTSVPANEEGVAVAQNVSMVDVGNFPRPAWLTNMITLSEEKYSDSVTPGVLLSWHGDLNAIPGSWTLRRKKTLLLRLVISFLAFGCLVGGIVGSILRGDITALQLLYFGFLLFLVLATCAFDSMRAVCIRASQPDERIENFTPVTAARRLQKSQQLINLLLVSAKTCYHCKRLTADGEPGVVKAKLIWNELVLQVLLCQQCFNAYLECSNGGITSSEPTCPVCFEELGERTACSSCENGHLLHFSCVEQWVEHSHVRSCPVCRGVI